jgi:diacylglycerol kinase family enzyme
LPNGSGDDACGSISLEINDIYKALDYIIKADIVKVDLVKILIDFETE